MIGLQVFIAARGRRTEDMGEQRVADRPFIPCDESNQPFSVDIWCFLSPYGHTDGKPLPLRSFVVYRACLSGIHQRTALRRKVTPCGDQRSSSAKSIDIPMAEVERTDGGLSQTASSTTEQRPGSESAGLVLVTNKRALIVSHHLTRLS